jgi:hypothetical protein
MKENRWIYVVGIVVLVVLVAAGLLWRGQGSSGEGDGGGDAGDGAADAHADGAVAAADGGASGEAGVDDIGEVPTDPAECRAYCGRLAARRALKQGATAETCVASLCSGEASAPAPSGGDGGAEPREEIATMSDAGAAPSGDCAAECRRLHAAGELRPGTTVEACIAALCADGGAGEEE